MTTARRALVVGLLVLSAGPAAAQVKYPPPPGTVDVQLRYRIRADRAERVRQFRELTAYLDKVGFARDRQPDDDTDILDPTAERFTGTVATRNVLELLKDPRVRTVLFKPTDLKLPDDQTQPVSIRVGIPTGLLPDDQQRLHRQVADQLARLGFREAVGYDTGRYSLVRGDIPVGNLFRLLKDLRREPAGWFAADSPVTDLPLPIRDTLPVRWVEVLPDPPLVPLVPPTVAPNRAKFAPGLRNYLDGAGAAGRPVRVEVVYDTRPGAAELDALRAHLLVGYAGPGGPPTLEGAAGHILTIAFPRAADLERFAAEPGVVYLRLPVPATETVSATGTGDAPAADKLLSATRLAEFHRKGYRGQGTTVVVIGTEFPGLARWLGVTYLDKSFRTPVTLIDLTAEGTPDVRPAPADPNRVSGGGAAARAAHLAAPDARLVLVRVDPAAYYQAYAVARFVRGDAEFTEAMQTRLSELSARGEDLRLRYAEAVEESNRAFADPSDEPGAVDRRRRARAAVQDLIARQRAQAETVARALALQASMRSLGGATVVVNTLVWEVGYQQDGLSDLSQLLDTSFASDAVSGPRTRSATRPRATPRPVWVQATSPLVGSAWAGPFLDANADGAMEFAPRTAPTPEGEWTKEFNFLGTRSADGKDVRTLPAGARVRLVVQWRETHDPFGYGGAESIFPLTLRVFRQLDPEGKARSSDEMTEVARSAGDPLRLWADPFYGVYEQVLEFTVPEQGRYALRIDGGEVYDPRLPALRRRIEIVPRLLAEFVGAAADKGRPVWVSYATTNAGVGLPGDAKASIAVAASTKPFGADPAGLTGAGPGVQLLPKPDLVANGTVAGLPVGGSGVAAGFAGGVVAALIGSGAPPSEVIPATGLKRGGPAVVTEGWLQVVPPR